MRPLRTQHVESVFDARLVVDGRIVPARPMRGSGLGEASGLAVVATCELEVLSASSSLPGRVLVLTGDAITRRTVPLVVKGAHLATFSSLVVITDDLRDLGHMGDSGLPVPVVFVARECDHVWMRKATRVSVVVARRAQERIIDVRQERPDRRRRQQPSLVASVPGTVQR